MLVEALDRLDYGHCHTAAAVAHLGESDALLFGLEDQLASVFLFQRACPQGDPDGAHTRFRNNLQLQPVIAIHFWNRHDLRSAVDSIRTESGRPLIFPRSLGSQRQRLATGGNQLGNEPRSETALIVLH